MAAEQIANVSTVQFFSFLSNYSEREIHMVFNEEPQWGIFCRQMIVAFEIKKSSFSSYSKRHKIKLGYYGVIALISLTKCGKIE